MQIGGVLRRNTDTWLTHVFGRGLEDDRYVVETFRSTPDGEIRSCPAGEPPNGRRRKPRRKIVSRKAIREMRPPRDEIIICAAVNMKDSGAQLGVARDQPFRREPPAAGRRAHHAGHVP